MITLEDVEEILGGDTKVKAFTTKDVDHDAITINLLRSKIPYEVCKSIIIGAEHDKIYLCNVEESLPYLTREDLLILADCNVWFEEDGSYGLFV